MRVKDFEKAIDALHAGIFIDEMVIRTGLRVKSVFGHTGYSWIKWDDTGKSFSCSSAEEIPMVPQNPKLEVALEGEWKRDTVYDLKFE